MIRKLQNQNSFNEGKTKIYLNNIDKVKRRVYRDNVLNISTKKRVFSLEEKAKIVAEAQRGEVTLRKICVREGITPVVFRQWTQDFLKINNKEHYEVGDFAQDERFKIVIEGKSGVTSIAQICRRENISQDIFLGWSREFSNVAKNISQKFKSNSSPVYLKNKQLISITSDVDAFNYFENYVDLSSEKTLVVLKSNSLRLDRVNNIENIVSLQKINDIRYINKYFEKINSRLQNGAVFIGCLETFSSRRKRMKIDKIPVVNNLYFGFEFLFKRVLSKVSFTKKHYFNITKGNDRLLSKAEALGRLVSCGFNIMDYKSIDGLLYFVVKKVKEPRFDLRPSYGPLYKMPRLGKNGKTIGVYKFRTMHPYSEYLQDYIVNAHGYASTGKPAGDFRIPAWGKFMRRFWLDELPQLLNVLKGELKLVGIRPVSKRYFQDIPKEMQKLRLTQKPGCVPPYVALNRAGNVMSVLQSEKDYLEEKIKNPYTTDTKYFISAVFNIVVKHKRSA